VAVMRVPDLAALAEEGVGLVEEQHRTAGVGGVEDAAEVLLRLADVLAHDLTEVDSVEVEAQLGGEHLGGQRLASPAGAAEQRGDAQPAGAAPCEAPALEDQRTPAHV